MDARLSPRRLLVKLFLVLALIVGIAVGVLIVNSTRESPPVNVTVSADWEVPEKVPLPVDAATWVDGPSISPEGNTLYYSIGRDRDVKAFYSTRTDGGWSAPVPMEINLEQFPTGACQTQDDRTVYFASVRPGGYGLADLYQSEKVNGTWGNVRNLGGTVNTEAMESEPYVSPDGNTLYFASDRKGGQGGTDIWMSVKTGGVWLEPANLGSPVNTKGEETQPFVTFEGSELYFMAVNRDGVAGTALFKTIKQGDSWTTPELVAFGMVGEPSLTSDKEHLYFVRLILKQGKTTGSEIWTTTRKSQ